MKKIIFTLLALVGTMSMNAQVMKVMKNGQDTPVETYSGSDYYVVFEEAPTFPFGQGEAEATDIGKVKWVQLWENGPKFAEYNVGAASATEYGGYYTWGGTDKNGENIAWSDDHNKTNTGSGDLTNTEDTATKLWGSKWRMPTSAELSDTKDGLLYECDCTWTTQNGVKGLLCKGKENTDYSSNSVFLPAAGNCYDGDVFGRGDYGYYWASTPSGSDDAYYLDFRSARLYVESYDRSYGFSVRAVLAE